jgi:hypothetical protein
VSALPSDKNRVEKRSNFAADFRAFDPLSLPEAGFRQNVWESGTRNSVPKYVWLSGGGGTAALIGRFSACFRRDEILGLLLLYRPAHVGVSDRNTDRD